jgi:multisubunit Na+/H+ antiporter MnhF subunit
MTSYLAAILALGMVATILMRVICVLHQTSPRKHRHPLLFLGFGYSYVVLGAGSIVAAVALISGWHTWADAALWLLLIGSCGLVAFDRRARRCWTITDCQIDHEKDKSQC